MAVCAPKSQSRFLGVPVEDNYHKAEVQTADSEKGKDLADDNHMASTEKDEDHESPIEAHRQAHENDIPVGCSHQAHH